MNCERFQELLHEHYTGQLDASEMSAPNAHAADCADCGELMRTAAELSCKEFVEFLNDYIDDQLDAQRRVIFVRHLSFCPDCSAYLDSYRKTMQQSVTALSGAPLMRAAWAILEFASARRWS